jgi:cholesterol oxidase
MRRIADVRTMASPRHWSEESIILLVMQTLDNSVTVFTKRGLFGRRMTTKQGIGGPNPTWIPVAHDVARDVAQRTDGVTLGSVTDLIERPITAHFIGGCPIGDSPETGVVDPYQRVYGYQGLHVADGAAVAANLGVNPSLTITAQAERAFAAWPNRGDDDPRPDQGEPYRAVADVAATSPALAG